MELIAVTTLSPASFSIFSEGADYSAPFLLYGHFNYNQRLSKNNQKHSIHRVYCCQLRLAAWIGSTSLTFAVHLNRMITETILKELTIDTPSLRKAASVFRAINHPLRQQMLQLMHQNSRVTVTAIYKHLNIEQPVASQHLGILRTAGIVKTERQLKFIYYSVDYTRLELVHVLAEELIG